MPWDYSTIYWNFSVAFFVHTAHGCLIQMCHQNYSKLSGTFFAGEILILYRANSRFRVPPGSNLNLSLMTVYLNMPILELKNQISHRRVELFAAAHSAYLVFTQLPGVEEVQKLHFDLQ